MLLPLAATVLAWQSVLLGKLPGWGIGLGGILYSICCRVLHTATCALFLACLARVRIVQNTDICPRCKQYLHPIENFLQCSLTSSRQPLRPRRASPGKSQLVPAKFRNETTPACPEFMIRILSCDSGYRSHYRKQLTAIEAWKSMKGSVLR